MNIKYIRAQAYGNGGGSSWENAGTIASLPSFITSVGPGGQVRLMAGDHAGLSSPLTISSGGTAGTNTQVSIQGATYDGSPGEFFIHGGRGKYSGLTPSTGLGSNIFQMADGADYLTVRNLTFEDCQDLFATPFSNTTPRTGWDFGSIRATNFRHGIYAQTGSPISNSVFGHRNMPIVMKGFAHRAFEFHTLCTGNTIQHFDLDGNWNWGDGWSSGIVTGWKIEPTDCHFTNGSNVITSPSAQFRSYMAPDGTGGNTVVVDILAGVGNLGFAAGTYVTDVVDNGTIHVSNNFTGTTTTSGDLQMYVGRCSNFTIKNGRIANTAYEINPDNDSGTYWNSDGIAGERGDNMFVIEDVDIFNSTDGGLDTKADNVFATRVKTYDCKRHFRVFSSTQYLMDCEGHHQHKGANGTPFDGGGSGTAALVWVDQNQTANVYGGVWDNEGSTWTPFAADTPASGHTAGIVNVSGRAIVTRPAAVARMSVGTCNFGSEVTEVLV